MLFDSIDLYMRWYGSINSQISVYNCIHDFRADGQEVHGQFYGNDFIYGGLSVAYENLWPSNGSVLTPNDICSVDENENLSNNYHQP